MKKTKTKKLIKIITIVSGIAAVLWILYMIFVKPTLILNDYLKDHHDDDFDDFDFIDEDIEKYFDTTDCDMCETL